MEAEQCSRRFQDIGNTVFVLLPQEVDDGGRAMKFDDNSNIIVLLFPQEVLLR